MKAKSLFPVLAAMIASLVLFHVPPIDASSVGGVPPPGSRVTGARDSGSGKDAAAPQQPARTPTRTIVVPNIVVTEALLDRLSTQPVFLPNDLSPAQRSGLANIARMIQAGNTEAARIQWDHLLRSYLSETSRGSDIEAMLLSILKESVASQNEDKKYWISKLKTHNTIADALSRHLRQLQELSRELAAREKSRPALGAGQSNEKTVEILTIVIPPPHSRPGTDDSLEWAKRRMDRTALQEQIRYVERRLAAVGEDKQMATLELQKTSQKQSQLLKTLSGVMKKMNETATAIVRNMK